jgi:cytoskeletal protein RodZ
VTVSQNRPDDGEANNSGPDSGAAWPLLHGPSAAFPDRETKRELAHARAAQSRTAKKRMYAIYVGLLAGMAAFGVLAAYTWERQKDADEYAAMIAAQNEILTARVKDLESVGAGLAEAAASKERETQAAAGFDTASGPTGPAPQTADSANAAQTKFDRAKSQEAKAEPAMQDRAKGDPVEPGQTAPELAIEVPVRGARAPVSSPAEAGDAGAEIAITAKTESWVQIVDGEGKPTFTKLMKGGDTHTLAASPGAMLVTGNPTGLELFVDGVPAPAFNAKGPTRREIALDPERLLAGKAEEPGRRAPPANPPSPDPQPN